MALKEAERRMGSCPGSDGGHGDAERASSKAKNYSALSYGIAMGNSREVSFTPHPHVGVLNIHSGRVCVRRILYAFMP